MNPIELHNSNIHPALNYSFDELIEMLDNGVANNTIRVSKNNELELFVYNQYEIHDVGWSVAAAIARGLIVNRSEKKIVALPFPKFFNWGEMIVEEPVEKFPVDVYEKADGSLIIVYHDGENWKAATKGSFNSEQAIAAESWLNSNKNLLNSLERGNTYLFEWIAPNNRIVINYGGFEGLVLLSAYNNESGIEFSKSQLIELANSADVRMVESYKFISVSDLLHRAKSLSANHEGWVLRYPSGYRVKIKGEAYCELHKAVSGLSPISVWEHFVSVGNREELKRVVPEEFHAEINSMYKIYRSRFDSKMDEVVAWIAESSRWSNKELGLSKDVPADVLPWLFLDRKSLNGSHVGLSSVFVPGSNERKKFSESFRPKNNILEGHVSSSAMNRFNKESE